MQSTGRVYATFTDQVANDPIHTTYTWLSRFGLALDSNIVNGSYSDLDHDGMLAWQEYMTGTNPTNGDSSLRITYAFTDGITNTFKWPSASLKFTNGLAVKTNYYNFYCATNLTNPKWILWVNKIISTPPTNTLKIIQPAWPIFYKISVTN